MPDGNVCMARKAIVFQWGASTVVRNKEWDNRIADAAYWQPTQSTILGLATHISQGYPWMPCLLDEGATRKKSEHCNLTYCLGVDIDNSRTGRVEDPSQPNGYRKEVYYHPYLTISEAKVNLFIQQHCSLIIESPSSTPDWPKFRLVFLLAQPIHGNDNIRLTYEYLRTIIPGFDPQCINADRFFYGAEGVQPAFMQDNVTLPTTFFEQAKLWRKEEDRKQRDRERKALEKVKKLRASDQHHHTDEELARLMAEYFPRRDPGSGNYGECFMIVSSLVHTFGQEIALDILKGSRLATRVQESNGSYWDIDKKVQSAARVNGGKTYTFGSLVYWANQQPGWSWPNAKKKSTSPNVESSSKRSSKAAPSVTIGVESDSSSMELDSNQSGGWEPVILKDKSIWGRLKGNGPFAEIANFGLEIIAFIEEQGNAPNRIQVKVIPQTGRPYECVITAKERKRVETVKEALLRKNPDLSFRPTSDQLESIFVKLREKFLENPTYKQVASRPGRQTDGQWLFPNGYVPFRGRCDWILEQSDKLPPLIDLQFPQQSPGALRDYLSLLSQHASPTYLNNQLLALGATVAGLHYREVIRHFEMMPVLNFYGPPGVGKSRLLAPCASLVATKLYRHATEASISNALDYIESIPLFLDDPDKGGNKYNKLDFTRPIMASALGQDTANAYNPNRLARRNVLLTSNQKVIGNDGAVQARTISVECNPEDKPVVDESIRRQLIAQADNLGTSFEEVLAIPLDLDHISALVDSLSDYRGSLDDRTIKGLSVYTYFAQQIAGRFMSIETGFLSYVFSHLIPLQQEEQAELSFEIQLDELLSYELSEGRLGPWNMRNITHEGHPFLALRYSAFVELAERRNLSFDASRMKQYCKGYLERNGIPSPILKGKPSPLKNVKFFENKASWLRRNSTEDGIPNSSLSATGSAFLIPSNSVPQTSESLDNLFSPQNPTDS